MVKLAIGNHGQIGIGNHGQSWEEGEGGGISLGKTGWPPLKVYRYYLWLIWGEKNKTY
jgi:hypothetical protein